MKAYRPRGRQAGRQAIGQIRRATGCEAYQPASRGLALPFGRNPTVDMMTLMAAALRWW